MCQLEIIFDKSSLHAFPHETHVLSDKSWRDIVSMLKCRTCEMADPL